MSCMSRRVLTWGVLLAISVVLCVGIQGSYADNGGETNRYKTVEVKTVQYVWELVSGQDGRVICQAIVDHPTRPSNDETIQLCADQIFGAPLPIVPRDTPVPGVPTVEPTPRPTPVPFDLNQFFRSVYWRFITTRELTRTLMIPLPEMIINLTVPPGQAGPYIATIAAYEPVYGERITSIIGILNGEAFTCPSARCDVPITSDSFIEFWATSSFGDESKHVQASLQLVREEDRVTLELVSIAPIDLFQDACANIWGLPIANLPKWASFPASPDELSTMKPYQYLSGKLLASGFVTAEECPGGGLMANFGANTCGLEKAAGTVIDWQNRFDVSIWEAGRSSGVPPRLIKTLIEQESQFWPGNARRAFYEYGLGQMSQAGADVALRWDNDLFYNICSGIVLDCGKIYGRLPYWMQATMRGGLMKAIDSECPSCPRGIDLGKAHESVDIFARTLRSNCYQARYILNRFGGTATYEDYWKYTLVSYHSGYQCLAQAVIQTRNHQLPFDWPYVSRYLTCPGSIYYVQEFWKSLEQFDAYRYIPAYPDRATAQFVSTPTPVPTAVITPTPVLSMSHIRVLVYVDTNGNNYPELPERVDDVNVEVTSLLGPTLTGTTVDGEVIFDLTGRPVNEDVTVSLPELFRTQRVRVTRDGEIPVVFRLEQPVVPPVLP